jgi:hypothetical protein
MDEYGCNYYGSIVGIVVFKEKVSRYNYFGLLLAIALCLSPFKFSLNK